MPKKIWQVVAKDYNSPFFRNHLWTESWLSYPKLLKIKAPLFGIISRNNAIEYIGNQKSFMEGHEALKKQVIANPDFMEWLINQTIKKGFELNNWTKKYISDKNLSKIRSQQLIKLYEAFTEKQKVEYAFGTAVSIIDFQGYYFVEDSLRNLLKKKLPDEKINKGFELFTQPFKNSFSMEQEIALLKILSKHFNVKFKTDILKLNEEEIKTKYPKFWRDLKNHSKKYGWVYYVYIGPSYTEENFLEFVKIILNKNQTPLQQLKTIKTTQKNSDEQRKELIKLLKPNKNELKILKLARFVVWGKPRRKDYQSKSYYHIEKLQQELANRLSLSLQQVRNTPMEVLKKWLLLKNPAEELSNNINKFHVCVPIKGKIKTFYGEDAKNYIKSNLEITIKNETKTSELKGSTAYGGNARGIVKIINQPSDMKKMNEGDILVSAATTPSIIQAIKLASAIVTDEGGLTCHASIVSRELKIPCVVGVGIATNILKDGDIIEVDANKGIIRKINE